jgi:hypothetical protein
MHEFAALSLRAWESYYVIVGSSAGALTGLQFVVMTLIAESGMARNRGESISAFGSPNVVHFCAALLVAAIMSAPWPRLGPAGAAVAVCGALGLGYAVAVLRRTLRQSDYKPVLEDWIWHNVLPMLGYVALLIGGLVLSPGATGALFSVAGATLLLVFVGIHNAWDTVMYVIVVGLPRREREEAAALAAAGRGLAEPGGSRPGAPLPPPGQPG